jgi:hypothetical protein
MPRASAVDSFVWRAAARPERARLLGAIAIAVSCGGLGLVAGRWSAQVAPDPKTRTATLIEAVAKETRSKLAAQGSATADPAPVAPPVTRTPEAEPSGGQAPSAPAASAHDPENGEAGAAEPPLPVMRPPSSGAAAEAQAAEAPAEATRAMPAPGLRRSQHAPTVEKSPAAPNYQALRDYVLSR